MKNIDVAAIYELWYAYASAMNDRDLARWLDLWVDDGILLDPDRPPLVGKEQILLVMKPSFDRFITSKMMIHTEEVQIFGDRAYAYGTFTCERIRKSGRVDWNCSGNFLDILAKQADGSWKIAIDCHNKNGWSA
jgi:uncharacterized protein (TIGR02246 family)